MIGGPFDDISKTSFRVGLVELGRAQEYELRPYDVAAELTLVSLAAA